MLYICFNTSSTYPALHLAFERVLFALPMHVLCGLLTGLNLVRRYLGHHVSLMQVLLPSIAMHGVYDIFLIVYQYLSNKELVDASTLRVMSWATSLILLGVLSHLNKQKWTVVFG